TSALAAPRASRGMTGFANGRSRPRDLAVDSCDRCGSAVVVMILVGTSVVRTPGRRLWVPGDGVTGGRISSVERSAMRLYARDARGSGRSRTGGVRLGRESAPAAGRGGGDEEDGGLGDDGDLIHGILPDRDGVAKCDSRSAYRQRFVRCNRGFRSFARRSETD